MKFDVQVENSAHLTLRRCATVPNCRGTKTIRFTEKLADAFNGNVIVSCNANCITSLP